MLCQAAERRVAAGSNSHSNVGLLIFGSDEAAGDDDADQCWDDDRVMAWGCGFDPENVFQSRLLTKMKNSSSGAIIQMKAETKDGQSNPVASERPVALVMQFSGDPWRLRRGGRGSFVYPCRREL
jgi:hypothetical protein